MVVRGCGVRGPGASNILARVAKVSRMCSAFPDTDSVFGSLGSFFAQIPSGIGQGRIVLWRVWWFHEVWT